MTIFEATPETLERSVSASWGSGAPRRCDPSEAWPQSPQSSVPTGRVGEGLASWAEM